MLGWAWAEATPWLVEGGKLFAILRIEDKKEAKIYQTNITYKATVINETGKTTVLPRFCWIGLDCGGLASLQSLAVEILKVDFF